MVLKNSNTLQIQSLLTMGANKIKKQIKYVLFPKYKTGHKSKQIKKKAANNSNLNQILVTPMYAI